MLMSKGKTIALVRRSQSFKDVWKQLVFITVVSVTIREKS